VITVPNGACLLVCLFPEGGALGDIGVLGARSRGGHAVEKQLGGAFGLQPGRIGAQLLGGRAMEPDGGIVASIAAAQHLRDYPFDDCPLLLSTNLPGA